MSQPPLHPSHCVRTDERIIMVPVVGQVGADDVVTLYPEVTEYVPAPSSWTGGPSLKALIVHGPAHRS